MYALTVDRRRSRSEGAELDMAGARDRLNQRHPEAVLPWSISAGDELQALFEDPQTVVTAALELAETGRWHVGIGLGPVETPMPETVAESTGPCLVLARDAVEAAKKLTSRTAVRALRPGARAARDADALLALLHRFGVVTERQAFGARQRLEGLMTGLIDLTYCADGRWYVLDYKSNRLPAYDPDALARAMAHSEYELQALIYTIALHRWLRFRLGASYDYARDFGGVRYLFCRGLDAANAASPGVHAWRFEPALIAAVDALFAGQADAEEAVACACTTNCCAPA